MNIALEQTEEHVNGAVTNRYGDAFIRGNNGAFLSICFDAAKIERSLLQCCTFLRRRLCDFFGLLYMLSYTNGKMVIRDSCGGSFLVLPHQIFQSHFPRR